MTPLHSAARFGHRDTVQILLDAGADMEHQAPTSGKRPLELSVLYGHSTAVHVLIDAGANVTAASALGATPMHIAAWAGVTRTALKLLEAGADPNIGTGPGCLLAGTTPLHKAYNPKKRNTATVLELLRAGATVDARNELGETPLMSISRSGFLEPVRALLQARANAAAESVMGHTALHHAAMRGHHRVALALIDAGAKLEATTKIFHNSPLHWAARSGHTDVVRTLLKAGANFNAVNVDGKSCLHYAVQEEKWDTTLFLLQAGALPANWMVFKAMSCLRLTRGERQEVKDALVIAGASMTLALQDRVYWRATTRRLTLKSSFASAAEFKEQGLHRFYHQLVQQELALKDLQSDPMTFQAIDAVGLVVGPERLLSRSLFEQMKPPIEISLNVTVKSSAEGELVSD